MRVVKTRYRFRAWWLLLLAATGCMKISGSLSAAVKAPDFKKSELIVSGTAVANGTAPLMVFVHLLNSDNSVVSGHRPEYAITDGGAVLPSQCFTSDSNGISVCILKALTSGRRTLKIQNLAGFDLQKQISFDPNPLNNNQLQLDSGGTQRNTAGPYRVRGTLGGVFSGPVTATANYLVYGSVQGAMTGQIERAN